MQGKQLNQYSPIELLKDSIQYKLGHVPSALSALPITMKIADVLSKTDIVLGKSYGVQAWFFNEKVKENFIKSKEKRKILTVQDFKKTKLSVVYCQQQLGLAAGYSVGHAISSGNETVCFLSDGDALISSSMEALKFFSRIQKDVMFIIDYNKRQLFGKTDLAETLICNQIPFTVIDPCDIVKFQRGIFLCRSVKGLGISVMEKEPGYWHYIIPTEDILLT